MTECEGTIAMLDGDSPPVLNRIVPVLNQWQTLERGWKAVIFGLVVLSFVIVL
ncbi:hypothetical protein [Halorhabdus rudnickae]|uniref:hypothetical protein n=1 Tax=Halorhabdus rudnickae TaxID=1775544 RepID=UPI00143863DF|nr:hypothetical protein [Halorhabdus rudnickae]